MPRNMDKLTLLRTLNATSPAIVEQFIMQWGSKDLGKYIASLLSAPAASGVGLSPETVDIIHRLKAHHQQEFPEIELDLEPALEKLRADVNFLVIQTGFPHVGARIIQTWGSSAFHEYADSLFKDNRGGQRRGFPKEIVLAIFRLVELHDKDYPDLIRSGADVWSVDHKV